MSKHLIAALGGVALTLFVATGSTRAAGLPACTTSISACGCAITSAGTYAVTQALTATDGATDCIDVNAANVNLYSAGFAITGTGSSDTAIGINLLKKAKNANIQFGDPSDTSIFTTVSGFATGVQVAGTGAILHDFEASGNNSTGLTLTGAKNCSIIDFDTASNTAGTGILISGGSGCFLDDFDSDSNTTGMSLTKAKNMVFIDFGVDTNSASGIVISGSSGNHLTEFNADDNAVNGLVLTSKSNKNILSGFETDSNASGSGVQVQSSSSNQMVDFDADDNGLYGVWLLTSNSNSIRYFFNFGNAQAGVYLGCSSSGPGQSCSSSSSSKNIVTSGQVGPDGSLPQAFGIAVDVSDLKNAMSGIGASGDSNTDLFDANASCGTNTWVMNHAGSTNPTSCISATP